MRETCRFCSKTDFNLVLDLGMQPLAGDFLEKDQVGKEKFYPLKIYQCLNCGLVQMLDVVPKEKLFQSFLSSVSMSNHFVDYANEMVQRFLKPGDFVVEIGSNDGVLLKPLKDMGMKVLGIEPVKKIAKIAKEKGVTTIVNYFSEKLSKAIKKKSAKLVLANNVFAHIDDLDDVMKGISYILADDGYFVFECQFLVDMIEKRQYDLIYHEHLNYYSISSLVPFLKKYGFEITEVKKIPTHGGSIRVYAKKFDIGRFDITALASRIGLNNYLHEIKEQNKKIVGFGAAGRANTLLNYCGITTDELDYIIDESPLRYGRFTPGSHIPVVPLSEDKFKDVDYVLILAWNYTKEIMDKSRKFGFKGKFIVPLPEAILL